MVDVAGDVSTAGVIAAGTPVFGIIDNIGDQDWYRVTLTAGAHYYITLTGDESSWGEWSEYPKLRVFDSAGNLLKLSADRDFRDSAFIDFMPAASGDYFISAGDDISGAYILSLDADIPESTATTAYLQEVFSSTGYIRASAAFDDNWYRVEVPDYAEDQAYQVEVTNAGLGNALGSAYLQLFDAQGQIVATGTNTVSLAMLAAGIYHVSVGGTTATSDGHYDISLNTSAFDYWNSPVQAVNWWGDDFIHNETGETVEFRVFFAAGGKTVDDGYGDFTSSAWSSSEREAAMTAFGAFEAVADVKFTVVTSITQADFVMVKNPGKAGTGIEGNLGYWNVGQDYLDYGTSSYLVQGVGVFNSDEPSWTTNGLKPGGYSYVTLIHEIGHGLGLKHPHDDGGSGPLMNAVSYNKPEDRGSFGLNQGVYTMMSYNDGWETQPGVSGATSLNYGWEAGPMALDIAQLQLKHGVSQTGHAAGKNTYTLPGSNAAGTGFKAIWDTGGTDTIRYLGSKDAMISLQQATLDYSKTGGGVVSYVEGVRGGFTIAYGVWIENATSGSGDDWLQGSLRANTLDGGAGRDTADYSNRMRPISVALARDVAATVTIDGKAEDSIKNIENVVGSAAGDIIKGDGAGNWITGGKGQDLLRGGGSGDQFIFAASAGAANADTVSDFKHDTDKLCLDDAFYKSIGPSLTSGEFYAKTGVTKAHDSDDRILYDPSSGKLLFDIDGNKSGGKAALLFATLTNKPLLDHGDFLIV